MNSNNKILIAAGIITLGLAVSSCKKDQDWSTDASYNRAFSVKDDISVDQADTSADIVFKTRTTGTYTIELATDTLNETVEEGAAAGSQVFKYDLTANKEVHATVNNLIGSTRYFLRIRCAAEGKATSYWVYYEDSKGYRSFKTKSEQIFNAVPSTDIQEDGVRLTWDATKQVSAISVWKGDDRKDSVLLSADQIAAGEYTFSKTFTESGEAIKASTTYKFYIWLNTSKRGELSVQTAAAMPAGDYKYRLPATTTLIDNDLLKEYAATAAADGKTNYSVTIGIPAGATIDIHGISDTDGSKTSVTIPDGMSLTLFGLAGGDAPVISLSKSINISGTHSFIKFENVEITDGGCDYIINEGEACSVGELSFKDCYIHDIKASVLRLKGDGPVQTIDKFTMDNTIVFKQGTAGGYSFINCNKASQTVKDIVINNTTFNTIMVNFILVQPATCNDLTITNCTFYNVVKKDKYFIDTNKKNTNITLKNVLISKVLEEGARGLRTNGSKTYDNLVFTNDVAWSANAFEASTVLDYSAADLFTDPANGDLKMKKDLNCGDPRWFKE